MQALVQEGWPQGPRHQTLNVPGPSSMAQPRASVTLSCSKAKIGRVIGRQGETIKSLQAYSGALIQIDQTDPDVARILISGSTDSVNLAVAMATDVVNGTFKGFALLKQYSNVRNGGGGSAYLPAAGFESLGPRPVYAQGYGLIPPSQLLGDDQSTTTFHVGVGGTGLSPNSLGNPSFNLGLAPMSPIAWPQQNGSSHLPDALLLLQQHQQQQQQYQQLGATSPLSLGGVGLGAGLVPRQPTPTPAGLWIESSPPPPQLHNLQQHLQPQTLQQQWHVSAGLGGSTHSSLPAAYLAGGGLTYPSHSDVIAQGGLRQQLHQQLQQQLQNSSSLDTSDTICGANLNSMNGGGGGGGSSTGVSTGVHLNYSNSQLNGGREHDGGSASAAAAITSAFAASGGGLQSSASVGTRPDSGSLGSAQRRPLDLRTVASAIGGFAAGGGLRLNSESTLGGGITGSQESSATLLSRGGDGTAGGSGGASSHARLLHAAAAAASGVHSPLPSAFAAGSVTGVVGERSVSAALGGHGGGSAAGGGSGSLDTAAARAALADSLGSMGFSAVDVEGLLQQQQQLRSEEQAYRQQLQQRGGNMGVGGGSVSGSPSAAAGASPGAAGLGSTTGSGAVVAAAGGTGNGGSGSGITGSLLRGAGSASGAPPSFPSLSSGLSPQAAGVPLPGRGSVLMDERGNFFTYCPDN